MLDTLGGRGRGHCREDTCRMGKGCIMSGRLKPVWRGVWEGVENSRPWCPLAVDDIGAGCL